MMTVAELIEALKEYPDDMGVVVDGYESGYEGVMGIQMLKITHEKVNHESWEGDFNEDENGREVVYIPR